MKKKVFLGSMFLAVSLCVFGVNIFVFRDAEAEGKILRGNMPKSSGTMTYVVLTNDSEITFQEVSNSIVSNNSDSQLDVARACIVEMR